MAMKSAGQRLGLMLLAAGLACLAGCRAHNPSYFPHAFAPFGENHPTHAKPGGPAYYSNFDPHAVQLVVRPIQDAVNPVRTQHVVLATVRDEKGNPRRARRVEWMIEGVGHILEVDESGFLPWQRGYKTNDKHAVSYTDYYEHTFTRGTLKPDDDFVIRPGQSWCIISSAVEGDTHVTVLCPEIHDWEKRKVTTTIRWVDAFWEFPPPSTARSGTEAVLTTRVFRQTDKKPLAGYRVRYQVQEGGAAAVFSATKSREAFAISDLGGNASAGLIQPIPAFGTTKISIEIIRPPEGNTGSGVTIARGETWVEWLAPAIALSHTGPANAPLGSELTYTTAIQNIGKIESRTMTVTSQVPDGLQYLGSTPPALQEGNQLSWALGTLPPGQTHTLQTRYRSLKQGPVQSCATVVTEEGLRDTKCATTTIAVPALKVSITAPAGAGLGALVNYQITVTNPGSGPAENVRLTAEFDPALEPAMDLKEKTNSLNLTLGTLLGGQTQSVGLPLRAKQMGRFSVRVTAVADGGLRDQADHVLVVQPAQASLSIDGPQRRYQDRPAEFTLRVLNTGDVALTNVVVRNRLPPELAFIAAGQGGTLSGGDVVWNVGNLGPREERVLNLSTRCVKLTPANAPTVQLASVSADGGFRVEAQKVLEILGAPALKTEMRALVNPVEVGKPTTYLIRLTNTGSKAATGVEVRATLPDGMRFLNAKGPIKEQVLGQVITFGQLDGIEPGKTVEFAIEAQALKAGDLRFKTEIKSPDFDKGPWVEEEATRVIETGVNPNVPPPPPPPPMEMSWRWITRPQANRRV